MPYTVESIVVDAAVAKRRHIGSTLRDIPQHIQNNKPLHYRDFDQL